jgi:hypothetical protein
MRRQEEVPQAREDRDEPFGPPPIEYPYRCPVCGTELLVNEAIIDVGIGMAKFQRLLWGFRVLYSHGRLKHATHLKGS